MAVVVRRLSLFVVVVAAAAVFHVRLLSRVPLDACAIVLVCRFRVPLSQKASFNHVEMFQPRNDLLFSVQWT